MATKQAPAVKHENVAEPKERKRVELVKTSEVNQKVKFLNLDTGANDDVTLNLKRYALVPYNEKTMEMSKADYFAEAFRQFCDLVQPIDEQIEALRKYAESKSYQDAKDTATDGKNLLTPEVRKKITDFMGTLSKYSDMGASDRFELWKSGYMEKKPGAVKILETVTASEDIFGDL